MPGKHYPKMDHGPKMNHGPKKYPQSNKFIGERKKAIDAGKKNFTVNGKTFPITGGGPKMVGSKEKYTPGNFAEMHHTKMYNSPMYYPEQKRTKSAIEAAIKQKKTGKTDPSILRVIGDPEEMKKDLARIDSMQANFKKTKDSIIAKSKMSSKDRVKSVRDKYKDFFNN